MITSKTHKHTCHRKVAYATHAAANRAVKELKRNGEKVRDGDMILHAYVCEHCGKWHVGRGYNREDKP